MLDFWHQTVEALAMIPAAELSLRLYLQCAEAAGDCGLEPVAYEFFTQAFVLYEEEISDSKAQVTALQLIIGTLQRTRVFGVENRDTLTHKATGVSWDFLYWSSVVGILYLSYVVVEWPWISSWQLLRAVQYSAKLLKKPDQCRAVYACSHLFWVEDGGTTDGERYTQLESLLSWWG
jgi:vacuolar protein sorting-associated protein 35